MKEYDIEAMQDVLEKHGIIVEHDLAKGIAEDFIDTYLANLECVEISQSSSELKFSRDSSAQNSLEVLRVKNKMLLERISVYEDYICKHTGAMRVGVENGTIYLEK